MSPDITGAVVAALTGVIIAFLNYQISKYVLIKMPEKYSFTTIIRQLVQVSFLVAVYFIAEKLNLNQIYLLIGAVLGTTIPMLFFTKKLLSFNGAVTKKEIRKEDDKDG